MWEGKLGTLLKIINFSARRLDFSTDDAALQKAIRLVEGACQQHRWHPHSSPFSTQVLLFIFIFQRQFVTKGMFKEDEYLLIYLFAYFL